MRRRSTPLLLSSMAALLCSCATPLPNGPGVMVLPGGGKSFEQFQSDNEVCKHFADRQLAGATPGGIGMTAGANSAALGTLLGAAAGAAINGGRGASAGAGAGLALGGLGGINAAESSASGLQQRYDIAYEQCMYAKGNRIPVYGGFGGGFFNDYRERRAPPPTSEPH